MTPVYRDPVWIVLFAIMAALVGIAAGLASGPWPSRASVATSGASTSRRGAARAQQDREGIERKAAPQRLWVPGRLPGLNEVIAAAKGRGGRGHAYATMKRTVGEMIWAYAKAARLCPVKRARLAFRWVEKDKRRDPDNVSSAGRKFVFDSLVAAGVLPGDGWAAVAGWSDEFEVGTRHGVEVTITEVSP